MRTALIRRTVPGRRRCAQGTLGDVTDDPRRPSAVPPTHDVVNTVEPLVGFDAAAPDPALRAGLAAAGTALTDELRVLAVDAGSAEIGRARPAGRHEPAGAAHPRSGRSPDRRGRVPPGLARADGAGRRGRACRPRPGHPDAGAHAHLHRAAGFYLWTQTESGHLCPISMTYAAVPALRHDPELAGEFEPGLRSRGRTTSGCDRAGGQARAAGRHVDDGEAGRLGRPGGHHPRRSPAGPTPASTG